LVEFGHQWNPEITPRAQIARIVDSGEGKDAVLVDLEPRDLDLVGLDLLVLDLAVGRCEARE
jgi:hypothetical protein